MGKFIFIAGPCVIESQAQAFSIAKTLKGIAAKYPVTFIFKASFDKANRTSIDSFRGPGLTQGLKILKYIKRSLKVKVSSDVHCPHQVEEAARVLDVIQIPAFLCRQTDLILKAAQTKKTINIKKGQFLAPQDVKHIADKVKRAKNKNILITERGTCFGYNNLVVDFRSFAILKSLGLPVIFDATHSVQRPSGAGLKSGGDRQFVVPLTKAAAAFGIDGLFLEVHPDPKKALSDSATSLKLKEVDALLKAVFKIRKAA